MRIFNIKLEAKIHLYFGLTNLCRLNITTIDHKARNHHTEQEQSGKEDESCTKIVGKKV